MKRGKVLLAGLFAVLMIVGLTQPASAANILGNPGFETGSLGPWVTGTNPAVVTTNEHSGDYAAELSVIGGVGGYVAQDIDPYQCAEYLEFWYWTLWDTPVIDCYFAVYYPGGASEIVTADLSNTQGQWEFVHVDLDTSKVVTALEVDIHSTGSASLGIDDFVLESCSYVPPMGGGQLFSANKLAVISPYLALISVVAVAAIVVKRKLT